MHTYKTKWFARFARREGIVDSSLIEAIERAERGIVDADLGCGLIKQRVARRGGGYRTILAYRARERAFFIYGFAKSEQENLAPHELNTVRDITADWLAADAERIERGILEEEIQ